ncbi:MAG: hypothetical protein IH587_02575 [Anaerolineae bacterium]|nr:hypothetical protein [Anaerolineae bacterium]
MITDELWKALPEIFGITCGLFIAGTVSIVAIALVRTLKSAKDYFSNEDLDLVVEKLKRGDAEKPKHTGEKLKRGDGEVLDVIDEKRKNDERR